MFDWHSRVVPAKNPRVNVALEKRLYQKLKRVSKRDGVSLSTKVRDLVVEALKVDEDRTLTELAESRERAFRRAKALKHREVW